MTIDDFWKIVDRVHSKSPRDMEAKCRRLAEELRPLRAEEVKSFSGHFADCFQDAYTWDVWGAAFVIHNGCSDDSFMDFRSTLISLGQLPFQSALANPDDLADFVIDPEWATFEGYQYVPGKMLEEKVGPQELLERGSQAVSHRRREPNGKPFNEWELSKRFPRLVAKYGYRDSDWFYLKHRQEKAAEDQVSGRQLANLMLESGIVHSCGLIPPPRIVAAVLRTGHAPEATRREYRWNPFTLDEGHYWTATTLLQNFSPEELRSRPDLRDVSLRTDTGASGVSNFGDWLRSLEERGLG